MSTTTPNPTEIVSDPRVPLVRITREGNGRTRLTCTSLVESFEARDAFVASGMEEGVREGYEKLDALLAG